VDGTDEVTISVFRNIERRHCEARSVEATQEIVHRPLDCFAALATTMKKIYRGAFLPPHG
jgi:hypothetical protein